MEDDFVANSPYSQSLPEPLLFQPAATAHPKRKHGRTRRSPVMNGREEAFSDIDSPLEQLRASIAKKHQRLHSIRNIVDQVRLDVGVNAQAAVCHTHLPLWPLLSFIRLENYAAPHRLRTMA